MGITIPKSVVDSLYVLAIIEYSRLYIVIVNRVESIV